MPKILRIINRFNIGGPTFNAAYLTKHLAPEYETLLVGGQIKESEEDSLHILRDLDLKYVTVPTMHRSVNPMDDYKAYKFIDKLIKSFKPDIVHTHASKAGALGRLAAKNNNVKVIVHTYHGHVFHSYFSTWKTNLYKSIERFLAKKSTKIIAISPLQKKEIGEIHKIAPLDKIEIIPLGFDLSKFWTDVDDKRKSFRTEFGLSEDQVAIGIVGRLVPIKNHSLFLKALQFLNTSTDVNWKAFIIGDGESRRSIEVEARNLGLSFSNNKKVDDRLHFTSFLTEMDWVMAGLDVVALSSKNEGTPVSLIEAQAAGKSILSTDVGGVRDVVQENNTALLCSPEDTLGFCQKLKELVENSELRSKFKMNGPDVVKSKFAYQRLIDDMYKLYQSVL